VERASSLVNPRRLGLVEGAGSWEWNNVADGQLESDGYSPAGNARPTTLLGKGFHRAGIALRPSQFGIGLPVGLEAGLQISWSFFDLGGGRVRVDLVQQAVEVEPTREHRQLAFGRPGP